MAFSNSQTSVWLSSVLTILAAIFGAYFGAMISLNLPMLAKDPWALSTNVLLPAGVLILIMWCIVRKLVREHEVPVHEREAPVVCLRISDWQLVVYRRKNAQLGATQKGRK